MSINRRLMTDYDFQEALDKQLKLRVFRDDHMIENGGVLVRFDDNTVVIQSSVSDVSYYSRAECEIFELRKR
ncbi:hypothetical protein DFQ01_11961 [Paenibacillus cellulosilyticus]|jgi:hypothetical protein|uniref:Uncharacterized protein n=1 Tax=Paenibacillus cellulosilyticus TaxID=375489 RepID=A0A2V2YPL5_9BACL|nr:hypothetical protein [Paenibacillus cellulosilyticus]PWV97979.1 hypothetical protein DFQ01_11961 [Paenibacillus cellulosilyticus]QKS43992.1 hypothetical protein HUB94_05785 [Paenibacillus cellulosilyticus]